MQVAQERDSIAGGAVPLTPVAGWCDFDAIIVAIWRWSLMLLLGAQSRPLPTVGSDAGSAAAWAGNVLETAR